MFYIDLYRFVKHNFQVILRKVSLHLRVLLYFTYTFFFDFRFHVSSYIIGYAILAFMKSKRH